jgi:hypothetical protein
MYIEYDSDSDPYDKEIDAMKLGENHVWVSDGAVLADL